MHLTIYLEHRMLHICLKREPMKPFVIFYRLLATERKVEVYAQDEYRAIKAWKQENTLCEFIKIREGQLT